MKIININKGPSLYKDGPWYDKQEDAIKITLEVLKSGGLVVFPTDTVYGLLADAQNPQAINKLLKFKDRPVGKAISVFVTDQKMAEKYIEINETAQNFFNNLLPGPFTLVCKIKSKIKNQKSKIILNLDQRLLAENNTLGIRIPDFPLVLELVKQFGRPLTATSANLSGTPPHYSIGCQGSGSPPSLSNPNFGRASSEQSWKNFKGLLGSISKNKTDLIDLIIDFGNLPKNKPSTVIDTTAGKLTTLRFGDLFPASTNSLISKSENDTKKLARFIVTKLSKNSSGKPLVFLLEGNLGAGKTIFTKGLGKALGVKDEVISPTFTISYEYVITDQNIIQNLKLSTKNRELSTPRPIVNSSPSDTKRLGHNIYYVEQNKNVGALRAMPEPFAGCARTTPTYLIHYDLYRIESPEDLKEIGFLESFKNGNIYSIEWPERIDEKTLEELKKTAHVIYIKINHLTPTSREISWND